MKRCTALAAALVLSACGGGGGDGTTTPTNTTPTVTTAVSAEGFWTGTSSTGAQVQLAVLEDGTTWGFYTINGALAGALYGNSNVSGTTLNGSGLDIYGGAIHPGTFTGTVATKNSLNATLSSGVTFPGRYSTAYDQAALLTNLAGTYAGQGLTGATSAISIPVTISVGGAISATLPGCSISGTATPRATGKNIFNVQTTFVGNTCPLGNGTVTNGIAFYDVTSRQVIVMAMNGSKTDGFMYAGVR